MECCGRGGAWLLSLCTLLIGSFNISSFRLVTPAQGDAVDSVRVSAVAGGEAALPCDTRTAQSSDALLLVVWYKDDVPIYSFDGRVVGRKSDWADDMLGGRALWHSSPPSSLRIRNVLPTDRAVYRCRIDYKASPTRNHKIILDVIELPEKPKIFDERNIEVVGVAGPYQEDVSLKLSCVVSGGRPMPRLRWWRDDKVIATLPPLDDDSRLSSLELRISKLSRDYLDAIYTCTTDNTPAVPPLRANVQIQMYLRPLQVEILEREQPLSVAQPAEVACRATGARPPAAITWWLDGKQLPVDGPQKNSADGNQTVSILRWTPRMEHDRHTLTCRASHVSLEHSMLENTMQLNLHYMPIVVLQLGSKLNPNDIEEGDDVYFDCIVRANPPAYKVVWEHNEQVMTHNQRAGVIAGAAHLALQGVAREQAGRYACTASNVEGDGRSAPVTLQVIYKPVCSRTTALIVGAALNEEINVSCEVDAFPQPKNFQWSLNNSQGTFELGKYTTEHGRSVLTHRPAVDADYGSLFCRATNLAGQQVRPCAYTLLPAVRPDPLVNCSAVNLTDDSVELRCSPGYDGGLKTSYIVEAWSSAILVANATSVNPFWRLRSLGAGRALKLLLYAFNNRGRSEAVTLRIHTLSRLALYTEAKDQSSWDISWALGIAAAMVCTAIAVTCLAVALRKRHRPIQYEVPLQNSKDYKDRIHSMNHSPVLPDDKNPDVVPLGKDFILSSDAERPPEPPPYGAIVSPPVGMSRSVNSIHEVRSNTPHTPITPASDVQVFGALADDRRSVASGTLSRRREVVTTRTPLLANAKESCV